MARQRTSKAHPSLGVLERPIPPVRVESPGGATVYWSIDGCTPDPNPRQRSPCKGGRTRRHVSCELRALPTPLGDLTIDGVMATAVLFDFKRQECTLRHFIPRHAHVRPGSWTSWAFE